MVVSVSTLGLSRAPSYQARAQKQEKTEDCNGEFLNSTQLHNLNNLHSPPPETRSIPRGSNRVLGFSSIFMIYRRREKVA
jgi:hypothetical protein